MTEFFIWFGFLMCGAVVVVYYLINIYNSLQRLRNLIPEARANINILLAKRDDLISQLLRIVRSYGIHEDKIFSNVSGDFGKSDNVNEGSLVNRLASLRMQFPALQADNLYEDLMNQLSSVESELQERRERLNSTVRAYNTYLVQFPNNYIASQFNFQPEEFLAASEIIRVHRQLETLAENCHS